ncbi:HAUS augmin-like complex subunit 1 isoform X3 [Saccopteryx bilineata]|uniref:HAUS augmin-like complex subunit 1 isoform X3 n=1 Tax=Saccopteryx bilineata TaxID=59482 RepID=UPI00338D8B1D
MLEPWSNLESQGKLQLPEIPASQGAGTTVCGRDLQSKLGNSGARNFSRSGGSPSYGSPSFGSLSYGSAGEERGAAKHLQDLLMESVNFSPANLSSTGSRYLNALVDSALALETKDTSLASFLPAVNDLTSDLFRTKCKNEEIKLELAKLEENLTTSLVLEKCLQEDLKKAELHLSTERAKADHRLQNMDFLKAKSEEFRLGIRAAEEKLSARGMDASLSHQSLVALSEKLAELKQQTVPLKKKLESYLDLMPSPSLALVKIEEAKRELDTLEAELTKKVDMMELTRAK